MAAVKEDSRFGDDLEAIFSAIEDNLLNENEEFTTELNAEFTHNLPVFLVIL